MALDLLIAAIGRRGSGRTVVGFGERRPGVFGWVRLVAPSPDGILHPQHYRMCGGVEPRPLDLIRVEAPWPDSRPLQPENMVVNATEWQLLERPASRWLLRRMERAVSTGPVLGSVGAAMHVAAMTRAQSVALVEASGAEALCVWDAGRERYKPRLRFCAGGSDYDLPLVDWHYSALLRKRGETRCSLESLGCRAPHGLQLMVVYGEPLRGTCYKMVAGILPRRTVTYWRREMEPGWPLDRQQAARA